MCAPMNVQAQTGLVGVELECSQQTIGINVHPEQNIPVDVNCVVTNTGSVSETISLDSSVEGNSFALSLSETSFELGAGEDANFVATFSASPSISVISEDYTITAQVDSWGQDPVPVQIPNIDPFNSSTAEVGGQISSLAYSRMTFEVSDKSTIRIEEAVEDEDDFESIQLTIFNNGNVDDDVVVELLNSNELKDFGIAYAFFSEDLLYYGIDEYRETVSSGATSNSGTMIFGIDKLPDEEISFEIELLAYSTTDEESEPIKVTVDVVISGSDSGGALGLDSVSSSDLKLVGMAGGGLIGVIILLVLISRLTKKATGKQKVAAKEAKRAAKVQRKGGKRKKTKAVEEEYDDDDDLDFDDFDDDFDFEDL